jgi:hypothetical protein
MPALNAAHEYAVQCISMLVGDAQFGMSASSNWHYRSVVAGA